MPQDAQSSGVLIIGAGSAGLLLAQALKKQGIPCRVFEQDASPTARGRDWSFGIYWAQSPLNECLPDDLAAQLQHVQVDSMAPSKDGFMPLYNGFTAELLKKVPTPMNLRLHRRKFLALLSTGVDISYGKRLARVESDNETVKAHFEDGTVEIGVLLVGAEGAHSRTREFLVGSEKAALVPTPFIANATITTLPREVALQLRQVHPRYMISYTPSGHFCWFGVHEGYDHMQPEEWLFMVLLSWSSEHETSDLKGDSILQDFRVRTKEYAHPFKTAIESIPESTKCWHGRLSYWIPEPWDNRRGTVTLIGDACHPMTYHRGQGLNHAIHDVASLARQIKEYGISTPEGRAQAIAAYEAEMQPRGKEAVEFSNQNSSMCHDWSQLMDSPIFKTGLQQKATPNKE